MDQTQELKQMQESDQMDQTQELEQMQKSEQMTMKEQTVANHAMVVEQVSKDNVNGNETKTAVALVDDETTSSTVASSVATNTSSISSTIASSAATSTSSTSSTVASSAATSTSSTSSTIASSAATSTMTTNRADQTRLIHQSLATSGVSEWSFKDTSLGLHLGATLWLLVLSGVSTYLVGALLWVRNEALRRARAPPPPAVDV